MNVTVNIDCTPEEARRFMGLPDLTALHEAYLGKMREALEQGITADSMERFLRGWSPLGDASLDFWQRLMEQGASPRT